MAGTEFKQHRSLIVISTLFFDCETSQSFITGNGIFKTPDNARLVADTNQKGLTAESGFYPRNVLIRLAKSG